MQGQRDTLLNDAGKEQAKQAIEFFRHIRLDYAFTSDLNRAAAVSAYVACDAVFLKQRVVQTTDIILNGHPNRESIKVYREKALRERVRIHVRLVLPEVLLTRGAVLGKARRTAALCKETSTRV